MVGLPKAIIKKYGVTKKAWAVFRGSKSSATKTRSRKTRKTRGVKVMARRKSSRRRSSGGGFGLGKLTSQKNLIGTIGGAVLSRYVGIDARYGAAAGSFVYGKAGAAGAIAGYLSGNYIAGMAGSVLGRTGAASHQIIYN